MRFINCTGNTHQLVDIGKSVPFLGDQEQEIDTDMVKRSARFRSLVMDFSFKVTFAEEDRVEQNLWRLQNNQVEFADDGRIKVLFRGHFGGHTGYSKANRNFLYGMSSVGIDVAISPMSDINDISSSEKCLLDRFRKIPSDDSILIHSAIPSFHQKFSHRYNILYTTVEASTIPVQFIDACDDYDEIWVASDFCKDVFLSHGLRKSIHVVPNSVDNRLYCENVKPITVKPNLRDFIFISVLSWNYRKGYDILLKAYLSAFSRDDNVSLLLVSPYQYDNHGQRSFLVDAEIKEMIKQYGGSSPAHISRCGNPIEEHDMPRLYAACDCFVLPSRGEGFGLPYMEASLCGLPIIATNYSGQRMFLNYDNASLLQIDRLGKATSTGVHFWDGQMFPEMKDSFTQLGSLMKDVYNNYDVAKMKNSLLQSEISQNYTCNAVGKVTKKHLERIWNSLS